MDTSTSAPVPPVLTLSSRVISGFWRRVCALILDSLILGLVGAISGFFLFDTYAKLGGWGRLVGFCVSLPYFGVFNSVVGNGKTIGKRAMSVEVVDGNGSYISVVRSCMRYLVLGLPFFLNGAPIQVTEAAAPLSFLVGLLVFGAGGAIIYLYVFNRHTRQSLHDLAVGTYVTRSGGLGPVRVEPLWRGHFFIVGAWCLACIGLMVGAPLLSKAKTFGDLLVVQQRILESGKVSHATVMTGSTWTYLDGVKEERTYVQSTVTMRVRPSDYEVAAREIAATILKNYPAIAEKDFLIITVSYGYDIGIARTWIMQNFRHSPREWAAIARGSN
jgi:uncharacterized RDD family membrane protein YckC